MPITYRIDLEHRLIEETWTGSIDATVLGDYWRHYLADPVVMGIRRTVVDLRGADIQFIGSELDKLVATIVVPALGGRDWKTALVVERPVEFGVSRQYQVFAARYSTDAIFGDVQSARTWLLGQG